jgi:predicted nucleic-acid-binding protein
VLGADTNILLRLLNHDDAAQESEVRERLRRAFAEGEDIMIGPLALAECVWTLTRAGRLSREDAAEVVLLLAETPPFRFFDEHIVGEAIGLFASGKAGFTDCLIRAMDADAGCRLTLTFDRKALAMPGFAHPAAA